MGFSDGIQVLGALDKELNETHQQPKEKVVYYVKVKVPSCEVGSGLRGQRKSGSEGPGSYVWRGL